MSSAKGTKKPKIGAQAEAKARKRREQLVEHEAASLQRKTDVGVQLAAVVATRLGLDHEKPEAAHDELEALAKKALEAEADPSEEWLSIVKEGKG